MKHDQRRTETILHIVLKPQFNRTCFQRGEATVTFGISNNLVSASPVQAQLTLWQALSRYICRKKLDYSWYTFRRHVLYWLQEARKEEMSDDIVKLGTLEQGIATESLQTAEIFS